ncbi:hypothetical protein N9L19_00390 [bacterium]|nr:hypothetical protein [bacterium]MDA8609351.1 hypothetical protein [bacterium]
MREVGDLYLDLPLGRALRAANLKSGTEDAARFMNNRTMVIAARAKIMTERLRRVSPETWGRGHIWQKKETGLHYRVKYAKNNGVNANLSLEEILQYAFAQNEVMSKHNPAEEAPYESIADFVTTIRKCAENGSHFRWPSESFGVLKVITHAIHMLPPGGMLQIKSSAPLPARFFKAGKLREDIIDLYHGTHAHAVPDILSSGLRASKLGAGQEHCQKHFGVSVSMVYMARAYDVALRYPIEPTTMGVKESKSGVGGASLVAMDHTPPLRVVLRCIALENSQIWRRESNQMGFEPEDLHITHVAFYRAPSTHVHKHQLLQ